LPGGVDLTQVAGDVTVDRTIFGHTLYSIPLSSDGIVPVSSAQGYPTSGPKPPGPPKGVAVHHRSATCHVDFGFVVEAIVGIPFLPALGLDYLTLQDLQQDTFSPAVQAYNAGAFLTAACSHGKLGTDQSAINQTTEVIKSALSAFDRLTATQVITVKAVDNNGNPAPGYTVDGDVGDVDCFAASPTTTSPNIVICAPTAASADVCWVQPDRQTLLCGGDPWEKKLHRAHALQPIGHFAPESTPEPWGLVLANGYKCRIRNGGSWDGRADNYVGAYSCNGSTSNVVLTKQSSTGPTVNTSKPIWTVLVGPLGRPDQKFPPPATQPVVTAYFAGQP
jgi:hypothetical protein